MYIARSTDLYDTSIDLRDCVFDGNGEDNDDE